MLNLLITQRVDTDIHGELTDSLEKTNTDYFNSLGINLYPVSNFTKNIDQFLEGIQFSGLILSGGGSVNPEFRDKKDDNSSDYFPARDRVESYLIKKMIFLKLPILGICHGMQQLNCYFGGKITVNIHRNEKEFRKPRLDHSIMIEKSIFNLSGEYFVNHYHNDGIKKAQTASCFDIFAMDSHYDVVEGIIHKDMPIIGIHWHPERNSPDNDFNREIINGFFAS